MAMILCAARAYGRWMPALAICLLAQAASADTFTLDNGMVLEGNYDKIASIAVDPLKAAGPTGVELIVVVDNGLTRTFVPSKQIRNFVPGAAANQEKIILPGRRIPAAGTKIQSAGMPLSIGPFDEWGYRHFSMLGQKGTYDLVQGITEVTPKWTKVEAIEGINHYIWDMRIATRSIPREQLSRILTKTLDAKDPDQRLRIVRLFLQMQRYDYARAELEQVIKEFPKLDGAQTLVKELRQLESQQILKEIELRQEAGQFRLAWDMLNQFPADGVAGEMLLKVRDRINELRATQVLGEKVVKLLDDNVAALKSDAIRKDLKEVVTEIKTDLTVSTLDRLAGFLRLADDEKMSAEQKVSLAVSGWLMGGEEAIDNVGVSASLVKVRDRVRQYLVATRKPDRDAILSQLTSQEGATNQYIAAIIAHMKPPVETQLAAAPGADVGNPAAVLGLPPQEQAKPKEDAKPADPGGECAPKEDDSALLKTVPKPVPPMPKVEPPAPQPEQKAAKEQAPQAGAPDQTGIPGLLKFSVSTGVSEAPRADYWVQLPPEYDPYRRYPCIVTLHGAGTTALQQIDWWAGDYKPDAQARFGQSRVGEATRHGYIVIAPEWTREHQDEYEFSSREWAFVLYPLRDAMRRFAIDTDRVFLTGHSMGGTAAWDMGLSHPSMWAGVIPIVPSLIGRNEEPSSKYIHQYKENAEYVPLYFVCGERDKATYSCMTDWDWYLKHLHYDVMIVHYLGRGHESFIDDIQSIFTWMGLHKRDFFLKKFAVESLRPWDYFFWWVETGEPSEISTILPAEWGENPVPAKKLHPAKTEAKPLAPNGVSVESGSCGKVVVWLSPEMVKFDPTLKVTINKKPQKKIQPKPETLLEDVRLRGDRQHPFWAKVEN